MAGRRPKIKLLRMGGEPALLWDDKRNAPLAKPPSDKQWFRMADACNAWQLLNVQRAGKSCMGERFDIAKEFFRLFEDFPIDKYHPPRGYDELFNPPLNNLAWIPPKEDDS
tara:strand:- start:12363 stop:12695 length:333 start_codon:yes stop_codon:yes gene_type:complete